ncbi:GIY-YIG nuclease family protein [Candidatus Dependentiae bacterium]
MYYVYILQSINHPERRYIGKTTNLKKRLSDHNSGTTSHTRKYKPWEIVTHIVFKDELKAIEFEKYLKSCSGRAFAQKRLL